jgi:hypothetical protein
MMRQQYMQDTCLGLLLLLLPCSSGSTSTAVECALHWELTATVYWFGSCLVCLCVHVCCMACLCKLLFLAVLDYCLHVQLLPTTTMVLQCPLCSTSNRVDRF